MLVHSAMITKHMVMQHRCTDTSTESVVGGSLLAVSVKSDIHRLCSELCVSAVDEMSSHGTTALEHFAAYHTMTCKHAEKSRHCVTDCQQTKSDHGLQLCFTYTPSVRLQTTR